MTLINKFLRLEQPIFGVILLVFHSLIWTVSDASIHFSLIIILLGIFLLWQPIWNKNQSIPVFKIAFPSFLFLLTAIYLPYESLVLFGLITLGIFGSRILDKNTSRAFDLLSISIITLEISIGIIPNAFPLIQLPALFLSTIEGILFALIILFFFSTKKTEITNEHRNIDILHGLLSSTLISLVFLGGIVINLLYGVEYLDGLLLTLFLVVTITLGISWFWNPSIGFSGLGVLWNRYSMSIGSPFETWINTLTTLIEEEYLTPIEFLQSACDNLTENEWLNGLSWSTSTQNVKSGRLEGFKIIHAVSESEHVTLFFHSVPGTALKQHTQLLIRMANQFYLAKMNQEKIRTQEHFQTIHHTGARLTHDIKNILQSIKTSLSIIHLEPNLDTNKPFQLLDQNLTQISARLENTLNKLKAPSLNTQLKFVSLHKWLHTFSNEHNDPKISITHSLDFNPAVPPELLDSVLNNLLSNALRKPEATNILININADPQLLFISVCDDGNALNESTVNNLFKQPVSSGQGMGIGLYQSAIMAQAFHYELDLTHNEKGNVCFSLLQHFNDSN